MSKIAICSTGSESTSLMDGRMGRCAYFMIYDTDKGQFSALANTGKESAHGAGTGSVQELLKNDVGTVVASRVGPKAFSAMQQAGVKTFACPEGTTVEAALKKLVDNELQEVNSPSH
ncbi:MAG: NifB/NifX family molybdenum-iron cluster-binding protein [Bacillota bacterium]|nr:NifB/NifX family molybdenum-iron cluster-binding protein [Bacillota bacterium]